MAWFGLKEEVDGSRGVHSCSRRDGFGFGSGGPEGGGWFTCKYFILGMIKV